MASCLKPSGHYIYHQFSNQQFHILPTQSIYVFWWMWEKTAIIFLYSINRLVCITETECVYCAVRTGSLYIIQVMCFVWIWEQTAIIFLYSINCLVCVTETESVYWAVRTVSLNKIPVLYIYIYIYIYNCISLDLHMQVSCVMREKWKIPRYLALILVFKCSSEGRTMLPLPHLWTACCVAEFKLVAFNVECTPALGMPGMTMSSQFLWEI